MSPLAQPHADRFLNFNAGTGPVLDFILHCRKTGKGQGEYIFSFRRTIREHRQVFYSTNSLLSVHDKQEMIDKKPCI